MKKALLFTSMIVALTITTNAQIFTQNFDTCTAGGYAADCIGAPWTTWSGTVGTTEDAVVSATQSSSAPNSAYIGATTTDFVVQLGDLTTGIYDISFDLLVETGKMAYFNILNVFTLPSTFSWATDVYVRSSGYLSWTVNNVADSVPCAFDTWHEIAYTINLNADTAFMFVNGTQTASWKFSKGTLGTGTTLKLAAMDFYGATEGAVLPGYYIDNFSFAMNTTGIEENNTAIGVYPNPANDVITVTGQENNRYEIMSVTGQTLMSGQFESNNASLDISNLSSGNYIIRCIGNEVSVSQFIVE